MDEQRIPTTVTIYGVDYRLRGPEDPEFIRKVAAFAEQRMQEVARHQQTASQTRVAVMALLNVVGELLRERESRQEIEGRLSGQVRAIGDRVEEILAARG